jgi:hypothetical protein|tara:strand:- start:952 stop:1707 length:756 start_codon:yes stop_codon:yes gene_type:complete
MYHKKLIPLAFLVGSATTATANQSIQDLQSAAEAIRTQVTTALNLSFNSYKRSNSAQIVEDQAIQQGGLTQEQVDKYNNALTVVKTSVYKNASEVLYDEHIVAMDNLHTSIDMLVDAASVLSEVGVVANMAADATTTPEQEQLQEYVTINDMSLTEEKVENFNNSLVVVETYAQQAGAFLAGSSSSEVTGAIDNYAANSGVAVSSYTAVSYTQSMDQFIIQFEAGSVTISGYTGSNLVTAEELYKEVSAYN